MASGKGLGHAVEEHVPGLEDRGKGHPLSEIKFLQVRVVLQSPLADVLKLIPEALLHYFIIDAQGECHVLGFEKPFREGKEVGGWYIIKL